MSAIVNKRAVVAVKPVLILVRCFEERFWIGLAHFIMMSGRFWL